MPAEQERFTWFWQDTCIALTLRNEQLDGFLIRLMCVYIYNMYNLYGSGYTILRVYTYRIQRLLNNWTFNICPCCIIKFSFRIVMFLAHNLHFIVQEMYATRTVLIIEQQVFESTDDIIYFSYYHDYILCFFYISVGLCILLFSK